MLGGVGFRLLARSRSLSRARPAAPRPPGPGLRRRGSVGGGGLPRRGALLRDPSARVLFHPAPDRPGARPAAPLSSLAAGRSSSSSARVRAPEPAAFGRPPPAWAGRGGAGGGPPAGGRTTGGRGWVGPDNSSRPATPRRIPPVRPPEPSPLPPAGAGLPGPSRCSPVPRCGSPVSGSHHDPATLDQ